MINLLVRSSIAFLILGIASTASGQYRGIINDPDGFTNVRAGQSMDSAIVAKALTGEVFEFDGGEGSEWWKVTLASGKTGWMNQSRIRLYVTPADLPKKQEGDELAIYGDALGINYYELADGASKGEPKAMKRYFAITDTDGGAAEVHSDAIKTVVHLLGDDRLAEHLSKQTLEYQIGVRAQLANEWVLSPFEPFGYLKRNFPKTSQYFFRPQVVDWVSPDKKYSIRKVFSEALPREDCKVTKAEVIERAIGKVVGDLSEADMGTGMNREGKVLWSPDSKKFAYFSEEERNGQTIVFAHDGTTFEPIDLAEAELPGRAIGSDLKGAARIHGTVQPLQWTKPAVLVVWRHEYFEGQRADKSIQTFGKTYRITYDLKERTAKVDDETPEMRK